MLFDEPVETGKLPAVQVHCSACDEDYPRGQEHSCPESEKVRAEVAEEARKQAPKPTVAVTHTCGACGETTPRGQHVCLLAGAQWRQFGNGPLPVRSERPKRTTAVLACGCEVKQGQERHVCPKTNEREAAEGRALARKLAAAGLRLVKLED